MTKTVSAGAENVLDDVRVASLKSVMLTAEQCVRDNAAEPRIYAGMQLLNATIDTGNHSIRITKRDPQQCANCDGPASPDVKKPFCGELCAQEAALVRYVRKIISGEKTISMEIVRDGIGTPLLMLRAGGYPERDRTVSANLRAEVISRDAGVCKICGQVGNEIDHIRGSANTIENLRVLCKSCNGQRVADATQIVEDVDDIRQMKGQLARLAGLIAATTPQRACDDDLKWSLAWRSYRQP